VQTTFAVLPLHLPPTLRSVTQKLLPNKVLTTFLLYVPQKATGEEPPPPNNSETVFNNMMLATRSSAGSEMSNITQMRVQPRPLSSAVAQKRQSLERAETLNQPQQRRGPVSR
jgi:hypothetical protein